MNVVRGRHMGMHVLQRLVQVTVAVRLLWRMRNFERPSAYIGRTLKPVAGMAKFRPVVCLHVAGSVRSRTAASWKRNSRSQRSASDGFGEV